MQKVDIVSLPTAEILIIVVEMAHFGHAQGCLATPTAPAELANCNIMISL